jgi:hypothetical protein
MSEGGGGDKNKMATKKIANKEHSNDIMICKASKRNVNCSVAAALYIF